MVIRPLSRYRSPEDGLGEYRFFMAYSPAPELSLEHCPAIGTDEQADELVPVM